MNKQEAQALTARIKLWVDAAPVDEIVRAYEGRVWLALDYPTWETWCDGELGGFKLPVPQRESAVDELDAKGMSGEAIASVLGVTPMTVSRDKARLTNVRPDRARSDRVTGKDGKSYPRPEPKPVAPEPETAIVETPQIRGEMQALGLLEAAMEAKGLLEAFEESCCVAERLALAVAEAGPYGDPVIVEQLNRATSALTNAQISIMSSIVEVVK